MEVPDSNVAITATTEAYFGVGTDGQGVAGWGTGGQLSLYSGGRLRIHKANENGAHKYTLVQQQTVLNSIFTTLLA